MDWFDLETTWAELPTRRDIYCVPTPGMAVLREYLMGTTGKTDLPRGDLR